jgi:hypothetical protein
MLSDRVETNGGLGLVEDCGVARNSNGVTREIDAWAQTI